MSQKKVCISVRKATFYIIDHFSDRKKKQNEGCEGKTEANATVIDFRKTVADSPRCLEKYTSQFLYKPSQSVPDVF